MNFLISIVFLTSWLSLQVVRITSEATKLKEHVAQLGQFPYMTSIYYKRASGVAYFCGGSLISTEWVITSAHCLNESSTWDVKLGSLYKTKFDVEDGEEYVTCDYAVYHPGFGNKPFEHDIGLIQLPGQIKLTFRIQPIRLPDISEAKKSLLDQSVIVSGWGKTNTMKKSKLSNDLLYSNLNIVDKKQCRSIFMVVYKSTVCARGINEGICQGDSGGPLVRIDADGEKTLIGIVTFVHSKGCYTHYPSGYIRVDHYLKWINSVTGIPIGLGPKSTIFPNRDKNLSSAPLH